MEQVRFPDPVVQSNATRIEVYSRYYFQVPINNQCILETTSSSILADMIVHKITCDLSWEIHNETHLGYELFLITYFQ